MCEVQSRKLSNNGRSTKEGTTSLDEHKQPQQSVFCTGLFLFRAINKNITTVAATLHNDQHNQEIVISGLMLPVLSVLTI